LRLAALRIFLAATTLSATLLPFARAAAGGDAIAFTAPQAAIGAKTYAKNCASCHGANLGGVTAPALVGRTSAIAQQSLAEVYEYISQQMPMTAPGTLSKAQYLSILAYILQKNGHKAGSRPLSASVASTDTATIQKP